jgi:hypothetical protein
MGRQGRCAINGLNRSDFYYTISQLHRLYAHYIQIGASDHLKILDRARGSFSTAGQLSICLCRYLRERPLYVNS